MPTSEDRKKGKLPVFQKRFNELRGDMSQDEFAKFIGVSRATIGFYENGERVPDALTLIKISDACDTDVEYLVGRTDVKRGSADDRVLQKRFGFDEATIKAFDDLATGKSQSELEFLEQPVSLRKKFKMNFQESKNYIGFVNLLFQNGFTKIIRDLYDTYDNYITDTKDENNYYSSKDDHNSDIRKALMQSRLNKLVRVESSEISDKENDFDVRVFGDRQPVRTAFFNAEGSLEFMLNMIKKDIERMMREMQEENNERGEVEKIE